MVLEVEEHRGSAWCSWKKVESVYWPDELLVERKQNILDSPQPAVFPPLLEAKVLRAYKFIIISVENIYIFCWTNSIPLNEDRHSSIADISCSSHRLNTNSNTDLFLSGNSFISMSILDLRFIDRSSSVAMDSTIKPTIYATRET